MNASHLITKSVVLFGLFARMSVCAGNLPDPAKEDFGSVASAVKDLLESSHSTTFAEGIAPSVDDWKAAVPTNSPAGETDVSSAEWRQSVSVTRQQLSQSARRILNKATSLKVDFSRLNLMVKVLPPQKLTELHVPVLPAGGSLPLAEQVDVVVTAEPSADAEGASAMRGEYVLRLSQLAKFPAGWKCMGNIQWVSFPATVADEKVRAEMVIEAKVSANGALEAADDPALVKLGEALVLCLRARETKLFDSEVLLTLDGMRAVLKQMTTVGRKMPPESEIEEQWGKQHEQHAETVKAMVDLMTGQGIDLKDAELKVKSVSFKHARSQFASGSLEGMIGQGLSVVVSAKSKQTAKTGKSLSGEYTMAAEVATRVGGRWYVMNGLRLDGLPDGVIDEKTLADMKRESSIEESGYLPVGTVAPDIEFVRLSDEQKMKLSDLRGKVVILDFWATWCGPCQEPMAHMQKYREENPEWKERVAVVALSIDDAIKTVQSHMEKRGWTNTFNTWVGEGAWGSAATKAFRVRGVPTCYVIDAEGKIVQAGHPAGMRAPETVNKLLK